MKSQLRGMSVQAQVSGLAFMVLIAALMSALVALALIPDELPARLTYGAALDALEGRPSIMTRSESALPPSGPAARLISNALARDLGRNSADVRAVWLDNPARYPSGHEGAMIAVVAGREAMIASSDNGFNLQSGEGIALPRLTVTPPFSAALRRADGSWTIVAPAGHFWTGWRLRLVLWLLLGAALIAPLLVFGSQWLTRPIRTLAVGAGRAALSDQVSPVLESGPLEVRAVARAINAMHRRLLDAVRDRAKMMTAIAHDLRTPLTALRLRAETAPPEERDRMVADIDRMSIMIGKVLAFARGEQDMVAYESVDLTAMARDCAEDAALSGHKVILGHVDPAVRVRGDRYDLRRALENIVDNASVHGGGAWISCRSEGDFGVILVEDNGPGVPDGQLAMIREPFVRLGSSRDGETGGAGLGLAIASRSLERYAGALILSNRATGGLQARLEIPIAKK